MEISQSESTNKINTGKMQTNADGYFAGNSEESA